jgi:hypothetical protein
MAQPRPVRSLHQTSSDACDAVMPVPTAQETEPEQQKGVARHMNDAFMPNGLGTAV